MLDPAPPRPARPSAHEQLVRRYPLPAAPPLIPSAPGRPPYRLALADVLSAHALARIERAGQLRFHCVGDTGGFENPIPQRAVAAAMSTELAGSGGASFFYHLGDVVYPHGEASGYQSQFIDAYADYQVPILGVPGNHDGEVSPGCSAGPLEAFSAQFCAAPHAADPTPARPAQHQPNVFWTLEHPWITIIGLYTGVADGGQLGEAQRDWLIGELRQARRDVTLLLAMHHPVFSADTIHGSNLELRDALDGCFAGAGRVPDAVLSAHVHSYQRYHRRLEGREIPYLVTGSGGYPEVHRLGYGVPDPPASFAGLPGLTLEAYQHSTFGFLTVTASQGGARLDYNTVVRRRPVRYDSVYVTPGAVLALT
ncbi:MAG: metallophosphoesterase [Solirubrobacteraceae bacterium]